MPNGNDHDLLIRIDAKLDTYSENFRKHCQESAAKFAVQDKDLKAAHRRIDWVTISGILALILLAISFFHK